MSRSIFLVLACLALSWAIGVNSAEAQPYGKPANTDKLVRVTYAVADLIVPIEDHSFRAADKPRGESAVTKETQAERLVKSITESIAKDSWAGAGGAGTIQYFPFGMAIVVENRLDVQEKIAALLADLRRLQDVQVSVELRLVLVSAKCAKELEQLLENNDGRLRVHDKSSSLSPSSGGKTLRTLSDVQTFLLLEAAQGDRSAEIMQAPKLTLFNAQQAAISAVMQSAKGEREGLICDVWPVVGPQHKSVRLALSLELSGSSKINPAGQHVKAAGTFTLPTDRTLLWHLGETKSRQHLFALVSPRVIVAEEEERKFERGSTEEQSIPAPKKADPFEPLVKQISDWLTNSKSGPAESGLTLPAPHYLKHPPQYFPPSEPYPFPKELRALEEATKAEYGLSPFPRVEEKPATRKPNKITDSKERAIEHRLRQPISLNFKDVPLRQAVKTLTELSGVQVVLDYAALDDAKIDLDARLTISVEEINMRSALHILLNRLRLTFVIENQVLKITTEEKTRGRLRRVTYPVCGLVVPAAQFEGQKPAESQAEAIKELIQNTVAKTSWESMGGRGTIQYFPFEKSFIINQPTEIHEEIQLLLKTLRQLQDLTVNVETQFVVASPEKARHMRLLMAISPSKFRAEEGDAKGSDGCVSRAWPSGASEQLFKFFQDDRASSIVQAPKLSLFNGQNISFECAQKEALLTEFKTFGSDNTPSGTITTQREKIVNGWRCELQPVVSADRRSVRLTVSVEHFTSGDAKPAERRPKTFRVADGGTVIWYVGESASGQHLFVLISPRVQVREEPEEKIFLREMPPIPGR